MRMPTAFSPVRVFLLVLVAVFVVEFAIMIVLAAVNSAGDGWRLSALVDSAALVAVLCPVLWWLVVRPLRALAAQRGALLAQALHVQEEERAKLARDLHDELGQAQTAILLGLRSVSSAGTLEEARDRAAGLHQMASDAVDSARRMARGLSPSVLTDLGLEAAADRLCEDVAAASGVCIHRSLRLGPQRMSPSVEIGAYRVLQEALTNAAKHAHATTVRVSLSRSHDALLLSVQDDGIGMPADAKPLAEHGLGMAGMRERVALLGGSFGVESRAGAGTAVSASIPAGEPAS